MRIFDSFKLNISKPGPGVITDPPRRGLRRALFILGNHFFKLVLLNMLYILACIPIITIPASSIAANRVLMNLILHGQCNLWQDFWQEYKKSLFNTWKLWGLLILLGLFVYVLLFIYLNFDRNSMGLSIAACIIIILYLGFVIDYALCMQSFVDLPLGTNIRNAFILTTISFKSNLLIIVLSKSLWILSALFFPYTLPLILIALFSISGLLSCLIMLKPIEKYIINSD